MHVIHTHIHADKTPTLLLTAQHGIDRIRATGNVELTDRDRENLGLGRRCARMEVSQLLETQCVYYTAEGESRLSSLGREAGSDCSHHPQEGAVLGISYTSCQHLCSDHHKA